MKHSMNLHSEHGNTDLPLTVPQIAQLEFDRRRDEAEFASVDTALAMKGILVSGLMEALQTEHKVNAAAGKAPMDDMNGIQGFLFQEIPQLPFDWKAIGLTLGAYVATNTVKRHRGYQTYGRELDKTLKAVQGSDEFIPHTTKSLKRFQRVQRLKRAAATTVAMAAAYKVGENLTTVQNMFAGGSVALTGIISPRLIDKIKTSRAVKTGVNTTLPGEASEISSSSATHHPELMNEYDPELDPNRYV